MTIILFIVVLVVLILVHEFGHLLAAKYFNIRADEFGVGFPPRLLTLFWWGETRFSLNAIPFGGFVKIFGEDPNEESVTGPDSERSFVNKNRSIQAAVLVSGVLFNALLAFILIVLAFIGGIPATEDSYDIELLENPQTTVVSVMDNSPAEAAGILPGDVITGIEVNGEMYDVLGSVSVSEIIGDSVGEEVFISYSREDEDIRTSITPEKDVIGSDVVGIGVGMSTVGMISFPPHIAMVEGAKHTVELTGVIAVELTRFIVNAVTGGADFSEVAGPVGIVTLVGDAWSVGFAFLLYFVAVISLHLTIINLLPFPALDGGRLLFVVFEAVTRRTINSKVANALNGLGFIILILLMIAVTVNDITRLFG